MLAKGIPSLLTALKTLPRTSAVWACRLKKINERTRLIKETLIIVY
jgi:hypothetical protein